MPSNVHDLRLAFKMGVMAVLSPDSEPPDPDDHQAVQDWLEDRFQEFNQLYQRLQGAFP